MNTMISKPRFRAVLIAVSIALAATSHAVPVAENTEAILIHVDKDGRFFIANMEHSIDQLEITLRKASENNPNQSVVIRADAAVQVKFVVQVISLCNRIGIRDYSLAVNENEESGPGQHLPAL